MNIEAPVKYIIRSSDRAAFKACRRKWDLGSKIRQNWGLKKAPIYLDFGTAIHAGLEVYYAPATWNDDREVVEGLALAAFAQSMHHQRAVYLTSTGKEVMDEAEGIEWGQHLEMGKGMLLNYFEYAKGNDRFEPVLAEIEFEVPIPVPSLRKDGVHINLPSGFWMDQNDNLTLHGMPVVYQGRIDLIVKDEHGGLWILDHKTAAQLRDDVLMHLELDEQMGAYCWALQQQLGVKVEGFLYNELYKGVPEVPNQNKVCRLGRWFSVSAQQDTSYELYLKTVAEHDRGAFEAGLYDDYLRFLKAQGNKFFRRSQSHRTQVELDNLGRTICMEAIDMLNDPFIYPNPHRGNCNRCWYRMPCLALNDGSDINWILNDLYKQRTSDDDDGSSKPDTTAGAGSSDGANSGATTSAEGSGQTELPEHIDLR